MLYRAAQHAILGGGGGGVEAGFVHGKGVGMQIDFTFLGYDVSFFL